MIASSSSETPYLGVLQTGDRPNIDSLKSAFTEINNLVGRNTITSKKFEDVALNYIRSIPASDSKANRAGYELLWYINSDVQNYWDTAQKYKQAERQAILTSFGSEYDKFNDVTFYTHKSSPKYVNQRSTVYVYIGSSKSSRWLRMKTIYTAGDWLFVEKVTAYADGVTSTLTSGSFDRDHNTQIWEWKDETPSPSQIAVLKMLAGAHDATLRFEGSTYYRDVKLSEQDKNSINSVLSAFDALNEM